MLTPEQIDTIFTEAHNADGSRGFRYIVARAIYAQALKDAAGVCDEHASCEEIAQKCASAILALGKE
jgi:hypothetical protein